MEAVDLVSLEPLASIIIPKERYHIIVPIWMLCPSFLAPPTNQPLDVISFITGTPNQPTSPPLRGTTPPSTNTGNHLEVASVELAPLPLVPKAFASVIAERVTIALTQIHSLHLRREVTGCLKTLNWMQVSQSRKTLTGWLSWQQLVVLNEKDIITTCFKFKVFTYEEKSLDA